MRLFVKDFCCCCDLVFVFDLDIIFCGRMHQKSPMVIFVSGLDGAHQVLLEELYNRSQFMVLQRAVSRSRLVQLHRPPSPSTVCQKSTLSQTSPVH